MEAPFQHVQFDIFDWHNKFQSCVRYFLDHAQHNSPIQTVAGFVNIKLPCQKLYPISSSSALALAQSLTGPSPAAQPSTSASAAAAASMSPGERPSPTPAVVTLLPYIRRLVATGFDTPSMLHGFFGDDWQDGIGPLHDAERRNYLLAAKSDNWLRVKQQYDMEDDQTIPFLKPLQNVTVQEIESAEAYWSEWLAMQDWMLGPRAPIPKTGQD